MILWPILGGKHRLSSQSFFTACGNVVMPISLGAVGSMYIVCRVRCLLLSSSTGWATYAAKLYVWGFRLRHFSREGCLAQMSRDAIECMFIYASQLHGHGCSYAQYIQMHDRLWLWGRHTKYLLPRYRPPWLASAGLVPDRYGH